jgi:hypothetical protein
MTRQPPPEAAGPGTETAGGGVAYGDIPPGPTVVVDPPRDPADRERDRAAARDGCPRCAELPPDLVAELVRALRAAKEGRPLR